jgi:serine/threonine protein kinase/Tol biopolymer transport system component
MPDSLVGQTVSHYRIVAKLGSGGMGEVYKAEDARLGRMVALKFLSDDLRKDPLALDRFEREARTISGLNHPGICVLHDIGEQDGQRFLVMELLEGQTLRDLIGGRPLANDVLLDLAIQIADALDAAHSRGIVHRDLKPANVFITARGQAKLLDFGLAKQGRGRAVGTAHGLSSADVTSDNLLTTPGSTLGTVAYMSPEQARGEELDARSDLFSLGALLYEMATGQPPFTGNTSAVIFDMILNRMPAAPTEMNPKLPPKLEEIIGKALEKDRDLRYQTAAEMRTDLKRLKRDADSSHIGMPPAPAGAPSGVSNAPSSFRAGAPSSGFARKASGQVAAAPPAAATEAPRENTPPGEKKHTFVWRVFRDPRFYWARIGIALVLLVSAIAAHYWQRYHSPLGRSSFEQMTVAQLTTSGDVGPAAISPDGKWLAYLVTQKQQSLWIRQMATGSAIQVIPASDTNYVDGSLVFSHDGNYLYFAAQPTGGERILEQVPSVGGSPRTILSDIDSAISLSPDERQLAFVRDSGKDGRSSVMIANSDGTNIRAVATLHEPAFFAAAGTGSSPSWSPDGKCIAVGFLPNGMFGSALAATVNVSDGKQTLLGNTKWTALRQMAWLPDGSGVVTEGSPLDNPSGSNSQIWEIRYPSGELRRITNDLNFYADASMTADGSKLVTIQAAFHSSLWLMPADISKLANASPHEIAQDFGNAQGFLGTTWTPKGDILSGYYNSGQMGLARISPATGDAENLNMNLGISIGPSSCGNGGYFVFETKHGLMRANPDGGDLKQLTTDTQDISPACSPDGKTVFYDHVANNQTRLWRVGTDGQGATKFADKSYILPAVSPDGKRVAVLDFVDSNKLMIMILDVGTGNVQSSYQIHGNSFFVNEGEARMAWTPDSRGVVYIVDNPVSNVSNLWEQPVSNSGTKQEPAKQITNFTSLQIWSIAFSPDGKQLLLARGRSTTDAVMLSHFD